MSGRPAKLLLIALVIVAITGLLFAGEVHHALHTHGAQDCDACTLTPTVAPPAVSASGPVLRVVEGVRARAAERIAELAPLRVDARGPPLKIR